MHASMYVCMNVCMYVHRFIHRFIHRNIWICIDKYIQAHFTCKNYTLFITWSILRRNWWHSVCITDDDHCELKNTTEQLHQPPFTANVVNVPATKAGKRCVGTVLNNFRGPMVQHTPSIFVIASRIFWSFLCFRSLNGLAFRRAGLTLTLHVHVLITVL